MWEENCIRGDEGLSLTAPADRKHPCIFPTFSSFSSLFCPFLKLLFGKLHVFFGLVEDEGLIQLRQCNGPQVSAYFLFLFFSLIFLSLSIVVNMHSMKNISRIWCLVLIFSS